MVATSMTVAGDVAGGVPITCLLYEGNITRSIGETRTGANAVAITRSSPITVGDFVEIMDDAAYTYTATEGLPVVKKLATTNAAVRIGQIIAIDRAKNIPAENGTVTTISTMINNGYLRRATVVIFGIQSFRTMSVKVLANKGNCAAGASVPIAFDISEGMFVCSSDIDTGNGAVALHRITGNQNSAVTGTVLMGFTGAPIYVIA